MASFPTLLAALSLALATTRAKDAARVPAGDWGGDHVRLTLEEKGGRVEFDCGHGEIEEVPTLDGEGKFDSRGVYVRERPGPLRVDEPERREPARYKGRIDGQSLTLTVVLRDGKEELGPFQLGRGKRGRVFKCR